MCVPLGSLIVVPPVIVLRERPKYRPIQMPVPLGMRFPERTDPPGYAQSEPKQGSVLLESTLAHDIGFESLRGQGPGTSVALTH
jgi:hypothetical protein